MKFKITYLSSKLWGSKIAKFELVILTQQIPAISHITRAKIARARPAKSDKQ
jgi:hypothetical protein